MYRDYDWYLACAKRTVKAAHSSVSTDLENRLLYRYCTVPVVRSTAYFVQKSSQPIIVITMIFAKYALPLMFLSKAISAWAPRSLPLTRNYLLATQFHAVATEVVGTEKTESFRLAFKDGSKPLSPWHDIPLQNADGTYNMVSVSG